MCEKESATGRRTGGVSKNGARNSGARDFAPSSPLSLPWPATPSPFPSAAPLFAFSSRRGVDVNSRVQIPARSKFRTGN